MALYYGYTPNVTNCFKANEKGHVESSVQVLRNQIFAGVYKFISLDEARNHMSRRLIEINSEDWVDVVDSDDGADEKILMDAVVMETVCMGAEAVHSTDNIGTNNNGINTANINTKADGNTKGIATANQGRTKIIDGKLKTNQGCKIEEEKKHLPPYKHL